MKAKLITALALSVGLGSAAFAQTDMEQEPGAAAPAIPQEWEGEIGSAFFSDPELGTLRSEDEVRSAWDGLSEEQQAQVRSYCDTVDTAAAPDMGLETETESTDMTEAPAEEPADDTLAGDTTEGAVDDETTASVAPQDEQHAAATQVCEWIEGL